MGIYDNRHLDIITYSSNFDAKTIVDLYTNNIYKKSQNHVHSFSPSEIILN